MEDGGWKGREKSFRLELSRENLLEVFSSPPHNDWQHFCLLSLRLFCLCLCLSLLGLLRLRFKGRKKILHEKEKEGKKINDAYTYVQHTVRVFQFSSFPVSPSTCVSIHKIFLETRHTTTTIHYSSMYMHTHFLYICLHYIIKK